MSRTPGTLARLSYAIIVIAGTASAATVRLDMVPVGGQPGDPVSVEPGGEISYELTAIITSDDPGALDNDGLAFFSITIETDLGVTQMPVDEFEPIIAQNFPIVQSPGTPLDDDIASIGGAQDTFTGNVETGIAVDQTQVLARGRLVMPDTPGAFTVAGPAGTANVFRVGSTTTVSRATVESGPGLTITVSENGPVDLTCPDDVTVQCESCDEMPVSFDVTVVGADNVVASCTPASGSSFPVGTMAVTCTADTASCSFNVTVERTGSPPAGGGCGAGGGTAFLAALLMLTAVRNRGRSERLEKGR